jgi:hypothetical protein
LEAYGDLANLNRRSRPSKLRNCLGLAITAKLIMPMLREVANMIFSQWFLSHSTSFRSARISASAFSPIILPRQRLLSVLAAVPRPSACLSWNG